MSREWKRKTITNIVRLVIMLIPGAWILNGATSLDNHIVTILCAAVIGGLVFVPAKNLADALWEWVLGIMIPTLLQVPHPTKNSKSDARRHNRLMQTIEQTTFWPLLKKNLKNIATASAKGTLAIIALFAIIILMGLAITCLVSVISDAPSSNVYSEISILGFTIGLALMVVTLWIICAIFLAVVLSALRGSSTIWDLPYVNEDDFDDAEK